MHCSSSSSFQRWRIAVSFLFCCVLATTASQATFAKASFAVKPPQPWIRTVGFAADSNAEQTSDSSGSLFLLDDHQTKVSGKTVDRYYHHVQKVNTAAGLDDLSQLRFYFEPSYQQLTIHFIHIHRSNSLIDGLRPAEIKVIQQEQELNQQLYNGTLAAVVFLHDLRVGDIVDYAYTVGGENPVFGGRYAETYYVGESQPIHHLSLRLLWPSNRSLKVKNENTDIAPTVRESDGNAEYVWEQRDTKGVVVENDTPDWFNPYPRITVSEFSSWNEVVQWALPLYASADPPSPELMAKIKKWQDESASQEQRTVAALRFVQDEIRYLGIELGRYSHQPTSPAKVLARRFGDCKDKSFLLSTILRSMGIDAAPALVNSSAGRSLDDRQPSPFAFDHVIVQVKFGEKTYWFDPTISYQRGGLDKYYDPSYERALVLRDSTAELEKIPMPAPGSGSVTIRERYEGKDDLGPVTLTVWTKFLGAEADGMRRWLSSQTLTELSKGYLNYYATENPSIRAEGVPVVEDDPASNTIVVTEKYLIDEFWKDNKHQFLAEKIYSEVRKPDVSQRSTPLRLRYPLSIKHTIEINLPGTNYIEAAHDTFSDDKIRFSYAYSRSGNDLRLNYSLDTFDDSIPVAQIPRHLLMLEKIQNYVGFELPRSLATNRNSDANPFVALVALGVIALPAIVILTVVVIRNRRSEKRRIEFVQKFKTRVGFAPETAIGVNSEDEIDGVLRGFSCGCGQHPYHPEAPPVRERFSLDGQRLIGLRLNCADCGRASDLYFKIMGLEDASASLSTELT